MVLLAASASEREQKHTAAKKDISEGEKVNGKRPGGGLARVLCALGRLMRHRELSTSFLLSLIYDRLAFTGLGWSDLVIGVWAGGSHEIQGFGWADFVCGGVREGQAGKQDWGQKDLVGQMDGRTAASGIAFALAGIAGRNNHHHHYRLGYPISSGSRFLSFFLLSRFLRSFPSSAVSSARSFLRASIKQAGRVCPSTIVDWTRWCVCALARASPGTCLLPPPGAYPPTIDRHTTPRPHRQFCLPPTHTLSLPTSQRLEARPTDKPAGAHAKTKTQARDRTGYKEMGYKGREGMDGWQEQ
jgi:hypothetical protein